jgi:ribosomal protein S18 acetylase RimI-like enzyme
MAVRVRPATEADFAVIGEICLAAYRADGQLPPAGTVRPPGAHDYGLTLADVAGRAEAAEVLVAVDDDGRILGCVTFTRPGTSVAEISRDGEAEFRMLAVAPEAQGRGIGRTLAGACLDRAGEMGLTAVVISVRDDNPVAKRLYAGLGFVPEPDRNWSPVPGVRLEAFRRDLHPVPLADDPGRAPLPCGS